MSPTYLNPVQYAQALGYARSVCARIFRDGGSPADALSALKLEAGSTDWATAVDRIAQSLCASPMRKAA